MVERVVKATVSRWQPLAIGAALSISCVALLILRRQRSESRAYEEWWRNRDRARGNGHRTDPQLFV
jgi:hypothetical protein